MEPRKEAHGISKIIESDNNIHRFLYLGDVYENGTPQDFAERYDPVFGKFKSITRPIPGNHDWNSKLHGYKEYWPDKPPFYSKEYGGWKLFFIDTNLSMKPNSPQYEWAKSRSREWKKPVIICHHHHLYSAGGHGDQRQVRPIIDLFKDRLCIGLSGHTHNMQLFKTFGSYTQVVVGCGGRELYPVNMDDGRLAWGSNSYGALRMDLSPGRAGLAFVQHDGAILYQTVIEDQKKVMMI